LLNDYPKHTEMPTNRYFGTFKSVFGDVQFNTAYEEMYMAERERMKNE